MKWRKKTQFQILVDGFYKECREQDYKDQVLLETERIFAMAWVDVCKHLEVYPKQQVDEFEDLIKQGVEMQWGKCDFKFDRGSLQIFAKARDGRQMELVSGDLIEMGVG